MPVKEMPSPERRLSREQQRMRYCARVKAHTSRRDNLVMPVSIGILCERCRTVYFISRLGKSAHIHYDSKRGDFKLTCVLPCHAVMYFHKTMLRPYTASAEAIELGYADIAECRPIVEM